MDLVLIRLVYKGFNGMLPDPHCGYTEPTSGYVFNIVGTKGNVLFNDFLNTFYLRLYGVRHMVKNHSEETCCRHMGFSFRLASRITHTTVFVTPVVGHWLEMYMDCKRHAFRSSLWVYTASTGRYLVLIRPDHQEFIYRHIYSQ